MADASDWATTEPTHYSHWTPGSAPVTSGPRASHSNYHDDDRWSYDYHSYDSHYYNHQRRHYSEHCYAYSWSSNYHYDSQQPGLSALQAAQSGNYKRLLELSEYELKQATRLLEQTEPELAQFGAASTNVPLELLAPVATTPELGHRSAATGEAAL